MRLPFDDETTARLLGVAEKTARAWRAETRQPAESAARLLALYGAGRVIPAADAWQGFAFDYRTGALIADNGRELLPGQLSQVAVLLAALEADARELRRLRGELERLEGMLREREGAAASANAARY